MTDKLKGTFHYNDQEDNYQVPLRRQRPWWLWALIALGVVALVLLLLWLCRSCGNSEALADIPKVAPPVNKEQVILDDDSLRYVAAGRLNIYVLKGGDLEQFASDFRKQWPDKEHYQLANPDTTLKRLVLSCPEEEAEALRKEIPTKLPDYEIIVTNENIYQRQGRPNDPALSRQDWSYYLDMVDAPRAWDITQGSDTVIVAVLDGDIDITHPEIADKVVHPYDAITHTNKPSRVPPCEGHGTHTSSTAVGIADNGQGSAGIAPNCKLMPINVFTADGTSYDSALVDGIMYAVSNGADVINMSVGMQWSPFIKFVSEEDQRTIAETEMKDEEMMWDMLYNYAEEHGVSIVKSAGNYNVLSAMDPANRSEHMLLVSAVDPNGEKAIFDPMTLNGSNWGPECTISAPGVNIFHAIPGGYALMSGTSMSAPMVSGGAALVKSRWQQLTPAQIRQVLITTASPQPNAPIGPIMDLYAALTCDPNNLPTNPAPGSGRNFNDPGNGGGYSAPGNGGGANPGNGGGGGIHNPYTQPIFGGSPYTPPSSPGNGGGTGGGSNDCDLILRQYKSLEQLRRQAEEEMERIRRECPECVQK